MKKLFLLPVMLLLLPFTASASFTYSRSITIDHTKVGTEDSVNFPVLVAGTYDGTAGTADLRTATGKVKNVSGYDIGFYSDAALTSKLNWETESYNSSTGAVVYWVQVPTLSHSVDTVIYMAYGDPTITTDQSNASATWDSNYIGVWHLKENPSGGAPQFVDSKNGNNGTANGMVSGDQQAGQIDGSIHFNGTSAKIPVGNGASIQGQTAATFSAWFNIDSLGVQNEIYEESIGGVTCNSRIKFGISAANKMQLFGRISDADGSATWVTSTNAVATGGWHYASMTIDVTAKRATSTLDSTANVSTFATASTAFQNTVPCNIPTIGARPGGSEFWPGFIDEMRVSKIVRSTSWNTAEYNNQSSPGSFYTLGVETSSVSATTPTRKMRLFEGFKIKLISGKIKLQQQ